MWVVAFGPIRGDEMATSRQPDDNLVDWDRSALLDGTSRGALPWSPRRWSWVLPVVLLPFLAIATTWGIRTIETQIVDATEQMLIEEGIPTDRLTIDASYRNVEVTGVVPDGTDIDGLEQLLERREGPDGEDIRTALVNVTLAPPDMLGPIAVDAISTDGESLELRGTVPSQEQKDEILNTAATTGLNIIDEITASGLDPSSSDADGQIEKLSSAIGGLTLGSFTRAEIAIADDGPVVGSVNATDDDAAALINAVSGGDVVVSTPPVYGALDITATFDGTRIVLNGTVFSTDQSVELVRAASSVVGAGNVVNNLAVTDLEEAVPRSAMRVSALGSVIATFDGLLSADASMNDTDITVNGEAVDSDGQAAAATAVAATGAANLRPGGEIRIAVPAEPELSLQEEIDLLQAELDSLQEEIRETVVFGVDSNELDLAAQETLDKVITAMDRYPGPVIEIGGHTDAGGDAEYNLDLSQRRADAVAEYITSGGIAPERLNSIGFGESQPLADNDTDEGRLSNRRVEFIAKESF